MWWNTNYINGEGVGIKSWLFLKHFSVLIICRRSLSSLCLCTRWKEEGNDTFFSFTRLWDLNDSRLYKIEEGTTHLASWPNRLSYCPACVTGRQFPTVGWGKTFWCVGQVFLRKRPLGRPFRGPDCPKWPFLFFGPTSICCGQPQFFL